MIELFKDNKLYTTRGHLTCPECETWNNDKKSFKVFGVDKDSKKLEKYEFDNIRRTKSTTEYVRSYLVKIVTETGDNVICSGDTKLLSMAGNKDACLITNQDMVLCYYNEQFVYKRVITVERIQRRNQRLTFANPNNDASEEFEHPVYSFTFENPKNSSMICNTFLLFP